ncbi:hypothetical protein PybrP1_004452 [[Pythium] brassicae (nom. inval.)]|nr:hypothetical protein PybrP1_004452 [[Pythium] brassicae (nom. inval.)]
MSINVELLDDVAPYLVSPYESFFFLVPRVKLTVESGNGYPGQGGCFYGHEGRCFVSQYRVVYVSDTADYTAYRSFSLPFYCIRDWRFHVSIFGAKAWRGHVNPVPGGGLVGIGAFTLDFLGLGFEEFRSHVLPLLEGSRSVHEQFVQRSQPSVLMVPAKIVDPNERERRVAYYACEDPMTLFVLARESERSDESSGQRSSSSRP